MKTSWWTAVITAGLTAGYATTVTQLSPGPVNIFARLRSRLTSKTETADNTLSPGTLSYSGFSLSPYTTLPTWTPAAKLNHIRFSIKWLAGWATATAIAAYYRHQAESRI